jgi:probable DNA repair protein
VRLTQQPHARIAVIVPSLEAARAEIDRVFRQHLAPELNDITAPTTSGPYEFSLGVPLSHTPLAATALDILRWIAAPLPLDRVSALILSPHFAENSATEHLARAEFDAFILRRQHLLHPAISIAGLRNLVSNPKHAANLPTLLTHLRLLANRKESTDRTHAAWATAFHDMLEAAGWAPLAHLDSIEFQTRRKWDEALDELATLDFDSRTDGTRISFTDALAALERIAAETLFAPESRHAPIQIMGPLESAGSTFDAIWFLRANDLAWPAPASPNPLLPWLLQRELAMPGADPSADTARARRTTQRIAASAPTVVFSYAKQSADAHQRPSPILTSLALDPRNPADLAPGSPESAPIQLDSFPDSDPIPTPPDQVHPGGVGVLQLQAACGFRAFAEKRLLSSALDSIELGLDARERGNLVHSVLERFWAAVETQAALKQMSTAERNALLARNIDDALAEHYAHPAPGWPTAYLRAEHQRLLNLLGPWLDYEANQRSPFTVQSREAELPDVAIGPLRLKVRVDRVDLVLPETEGDQPGEIILDYKTGSAHPSEWLGPRPDAPQLPLYAVVANPQNLAAVAFANVRLGKDMALTGYQAHNGILPKPAPLKADSLDAQVREWRDVLTSLAEDFHAGNASVSPKHYPQTCQYCEQRLLCRLNPSSLDPDVLEEIDEESDTLEENDFA